MKQITDEARRNRSVVLGSATSELFTEFSGQP